MIKVTIWNEFRHEKVEGGVPAQVYPKGIHMALRDELAAPDLDIRTATLDEPEQGLPDSLLDDTDCLVWWGHKAHGEVDDALVKRILKRIWSGMGLVVLHSGHYSKIFQAVNGTSCRLRWREIGEKCRIWCTDPSHPVAQGVPETFTLEHEEMYGEPYMLAPDAHVVFSSWFQGGETFRSGVAFQRENGRIFYFQPGHETYPNYHDANVLKVIGNAIRWTGSAEKRVYPPMHRIEALEKVD
jgi:trehalose utilization protein